MKPWLYRRTRLLNVLHWFGLSQAHSQMNAMERECLARHARKRRSAVEIGTYMGVTATIIAREMDESAKLICIDPFPDVNGKKNIGLVIAERMFKRAGVFDKIVIMRGLSTAPEIKTNVPGDIDFMLIDGDHSYEGLANDWEIARRCIRNGGIVCLHDTVVPKEEPYRRFGSVEYFDKVISCDSDFEVIEMCYSMTVLRRLR